MKAQVLANFIAELTRSSKKSNKKHSGYC